MSDSRGKLRLESQIDLTPNPVVSISKLIFENQSWRDENSTIILSHTGNEMLSISLQQLRQLVSLTFNHLQARGFKAGETVLLCRLEGCSEVQTALIMLALAAYGIRVFLPMYFENEVLEEWLEIATVSKVIIPEQQLHQHAGFYRQKAQLAHIKELAKARNLPVFDFEKKGNNDGILPASLQPAASCTVLADHTESPVSPDAELLIVTTSGSSSKSKLVVYTQQALLNSCWSWQNAGFFHPDLMGGRSLTPLISHTMGIRGLLNAVWSGHPVCMVNTDYYTHKPEVARFFLMDMQPQNITGGPALYKTILEMIRNFPELGSVLRESINTLVSSGTAFEKDKLVAIENAFNTRLHNAFGTTETQQIACTLLSKSSQPHDKNALGELLPGVSIELTPFDQDSELYALGIQAPFMHSRTLFETDRETERQSYRPASRFDPFFQTNDLVRLSPAGDLIYVGRTQDDFIKDGFGVKIPLADLKSYYAGLIEDFDYVHFVPSNAYPGLSVLLFTEEILKGDRRLQVKERIKALNSNLKKQLNPFEYDHRHLVAFQIINAEAPRTPKGSISIDLIRKNHAHEIVGLENLFIRQPEVVLTHEQELTDDAFTEYSNPLIGSLTKILKMNWHFHSGQGDILYTNQKGSEQKVLDFVGGYGSNLLGHHHPKIKKAILAFIHEGSLPLSDQFSKHTEMGLLARELGLMLARFQSGSFVTQFGSTGSEVVEMAIHHAYLEWKQQFKKMEAEQFRLFAEMAPETLRKVWKANKKLIELQRVSMVAHKRAYHGLSLGSRSLIAGKRRKSFSALLPLDVLRIDDQANWQDKFEKEREQATVEIQVLQSDGRQIQVVPRRISCIIASIFEPVLGEGGVRELDPKVLPFFEQQDFPLIIDEIQSGLGRTGTFIASVGIQGDYYLFSKSLGGGFSKIGALMIRKSRFVKKFPKYYLSTFSLGAMAAHVARTVLSVIREEKIEEKSALKGAYLLSSLNELQIEFPDLIQTVSGKGLMCGLKIANLDHLNLILLRAMQQHKLLGYVFSAYLLNEHHIRVLPTLSAPNTLRFEPSAYIKESAIDRLMAALRQLFSLLDTGKTYDLLRFMMDGDPFTDNRGYQPKVGFLNPCLEKPAKGAKQIAGILHFAYPTEELRMIDPDLSQASDTGLRILFNKIQSILAGKTIQLCAQNLHQGKVHLNVYSIVADSAELERRQKAGKRNVMVRKIQLAVDQAARKGAQVVSLGGYTSILTRNGTQIAAPKGVQVITGNSLTAGMGIARMLKIMNDLRTEAQEIKLAVVGATGNIGSLISRALLTQQNFSSILLISRRKFNAQQLQASYELPIDLNIEKAAIQFSNQISAIQSCNFIVAASNVSDPIIFPHHIRKGSRVCIFDLSIPSAVSPEVAQMELVQVIPFAAYTKLPHDPDFVISTCIPRGSLFCCTTEAILCALEPIDFKLTGRIDPLAVKDLMQIAARHGYAAGLDEVKSFKTPTG